MIYTKWCKRLQILFQALGVVLLLVVHFKSVLFQTLNITYNPWPLALAIKYVLWTHIQVNLQQQKGVDIMKFKNYMYCNLNSTPTYIYLSYPPCTSPRTIKGKLKKNALVISPISLHSLTVYMTSVFAILTKRNIGIPINFNVNLSYFKYRLIRS